MARLDLYEKRPEGMDEYLSDYGYHFSRKMCEWAVSKMKDRDGNRLQARTKEQVDTILRNNNITLDHDKGYDAVYVMHMALSDFMGSSISDEVHLARYVKDYIDDKDGYDGLPFTRFYADCIGRGEPIMWHDML